MEIDSEQNGKKDKGRLPVRNFARPIILSGMLLCAFAFLFWTSVGGETEEYKFLTDSVLATLTLVVIAIQVAINRKQWEVMRESLHQSDRIIVGMESQLAAMKRQSEAIEEQLALQASAQRPWLFLIPDQEFRATPGTSKLDWKIWNRGKTTANIIEIGVRCVADIRMAEVVNSPPEYGTSIPFPGVPIAPNGELDAFVYIETPSMKQAVGESDGLTIGIKEAGRIMGGVSDVIAYGFVKYRDHTREYESRFCYYYAFNFKEFRINLRAPSEYHRCT